MHHHNHLRLNRHDGAVGNTVRAVTRLDQKNQKKRQREQNKIKILNPSTAISAACEMLRIYLTHNGDNDNNDDGEHHHLQQLTTAHRGERSDL